MNGPSWVASVSTIMQVNIIPGSNMHNCWCHKATRAKQSIILRNEMDNSQKQTVHSSFQFMGASYYQ